MGTRCHSGRYFRSIKTGIPNTEMKGWGNVLKSGKLIHSSVLLLLRRKHLPKRINPFLQNAAADYNLKVEKLDRDILPYPGQLSL
jgi:hypothetical protein